MSFHYPFSNSGFGLAALIVVLGCTAEARDTDPLQLSAQTRPNDKRPEVAAKASELPAPSAPRGEPLELAGDLRPDKAADLSFKIGGQLVSMHVQRGEKVKKNQLLATLSNAEVRAQLAQAEATISQAEAGLALARDNERRSAALVASNAAPDSQAIAVKLQAQQAQAALGQAVAARDLIVANLENHVLRAPFAGEIVKVPDGIGQTVSPGMALFRLETLDHLVLRTTINEADVDRVKVGDEVAIDTNAGKKMTGKVRLVLRSLEAQSRRAPVEVDVPNDSGNLIAGSYVRATHKSR